MFGWSAAPAGEVFVFDPFFDVGVVCAGEAFVGDSVVVGAAV